MECRTANKFAKAVFLQQVNLKYGSEWKIWVISETTHSYYKETLIVPYQSKLRKVSCITKQWQLWTAVVQIWQGETLGDNLESTLELQQ